MHLPDYGKWAAQESEEISVIPSLIHYGEGNARWIGNQVLEKGLYHSRRTFRWMKQYISHRSPMRVRLDGREITPFTAGEDFLTAVLGIAAKEHDLESASVAFSAPVEAFEHYENWLTRLAEHAGIRHYYLIDEPSAAALGYSASIQPGSVFLIFDFGGGTMHAAVVRMEEDHPDRNGPRSRVLGKAGRNTGGSRIDQWLFQDILRRHGLRDSDDPVREASTRLLVEAERLKEALSACDQAAMNPIILPDGRQMEAAFTRQDLEQLLERQGLYAEITAMLNAAIQHAQERGYGESDVQAVLMVGGSSQIPSVRALLQRRFGADRVFCHRPLDAVARGAAAYASGVDFFNHIQHDYAVRYVDPLNKAYEYRIIARRGTPYPTPEPVARLLVKPTFTGQKSLGVAIFEMSARQQDSPASLELIFDPDGAARLVPVTAKEAAERSLFWMNEDNPTFLPADPPGEPGKARFEVEFRIDSRKRLTVTARDQLTGCQVLVDHPVVQLT